VSDFITESEAKLLEELGPLEMARLIETLVGDLEWIEAFAGIRSQDDSKTFARVNRGALRNIAACATAAINRVPS
jgi:hypothetical protein